RDCAQGLTARPVYLDASYTGRAALAGVRRSSGGTGRCPVQGAAALVWALSRVVDFATIRAYIPILTRMLDSATPLIHLDGGATSQRPQQVIDAEVAYLLSDNAAVKRGAHRMAGFATDAYENARERIADFLGAPSP